MRSAPVGVRAQQDPARGVGAAFEKVLRALDRSHASVPQVKSGDQAGLLALQAAIYREAQRIEITTRVVDQIVNGVKTVLQTRL